ncbi:GNAT family N-acetyltransferase [Thalassobacillus devorans]|uniref:GNAT family N-acetyltransferase n=1 Tax=Thalassobacillus devorans TaxID=279813 RepID=UPI0004BC4BE9|nr:GNAT family N-acetyltransferase [Thalassobacillus devorans]
MADTILAEEHQTEEIFHLYQACAEVLAAQAISQWDENYPGRDFIDRAIRNKELYVMMEDKSIIGAVILNEEETLEWEAIEWRDVIGKPLVLHGLCISPTHQRKGYGRRLIEWCDNYAKEQDYTSIRLDTFDGNPVSNQLYLHNDFQLRGFVEFTHRPSDAQRYNCYEKWITI